ncbi:hypothetical protein HOD08_04235 [bacterium]|nr:hypothetical protein [bacterium]
MKNILKLAVALCIATIIHQAADACLSSMSILRKGNHFVYLLTGPICNNDTPWNEQLGRILYHLRDKESDTRKGPLKEFNSIHVKDSSCLENDFLKTFETSPEVDIAIRAHPKRKLSNFSINHSVILGAKNHIWFPLIAGLRKTNPKLLKETETFFAMLAEIASLHVVPLLVHTKFNMKPEEQKRFNQISDGVSKAPANFLISNLEKGAHDLAHCCYKHCPEDIEFIKNIDLVLKEIKNLQNLFGDTNEPIGKLYTEIIEKKYHNKKIATDSQLYSINNLCIRRLFEPLRFMVRRSKVPGGNGGEFYMTPFSYYVINEIEEHNAWKPRRTLVTAIITDVVPVFKYLTESAGFTHIANTEHRALPGIKKEDVLFDLYLMRPELMEDIMMSAQIAAVEELRKPLGKGTLSLLEEENYEKFIEHEELNQALLFYDLN